MSVMLNVFIKSLHFRVYRLMRQTRVFKSARTSLTRSARWFARRCNALTFTGSRTSNRPSSSISRDWLWVNSRLVPSAGWFRPLRRAQGQGLQVNCLCFSRLSMSITWLREMMWRLLQRTICVVCSRKLFQMIKYWEAFLPEAKTITC